MGEQDGSITYRNPENESARPKLIAGILGCKPSLFNGVVRGGGGGYRKDIAKMVMAEYEEVKGSLRLVRLFKRCTHGWKKKKKKILIKNLLSKKKKKKKK